jgi:hypothetical protein
MSLWSIRITMSDDPNSQALLMSPRDTEITGDVIIELPRDDGLGTLLSELHMISPQVFVSSVNRPSSLAAARPLRTAAPAAALPR